MPYTVQCLPGQTNERATYHIRKKIREEKINRVEEKKKIRGMSVK